MRNYIAKNRQAFKELFDRIVATDKKGDNVPLEEALLHLINMIIKQVSSGRKLFFIGNGGSASIASHIATDFLKNAKIAARAFNDPSQLTCIANDLGYAHVFEEPIKMFADAGDILFAISSSGQSQNILLGVKSARARGAMVVTLSGFDKNNPLRSSGEINFYAPSASYGHVEIAHLSICHCLVDAVIENKNG